MINAVGIARDRMDTTSKRALRDLNYAHFAPPSLVVYFKSSACSFLVLTVVRTQ
jgi:hypothetical protein